MKRYQTFLLCALLLLLAFGFDLITPQALVAAVLLMVPVALSSLLLDRRITAGFVAAALAADIAAGWSNGIHSGYHWDAIAVANRTLAAFSIVLVALLGALAQRAAVNAGKAAASERQTEHEQAAVAAAQASLFVELGNKNAELLRANAALEHRGEVIRDLVYALSHDLRTPLAAAGMTAQQALDGMYGTLPEAYRDILQQSLASNDELRRLAETLLMVARYESGHHSSVREPVSLDRVAQSIVTELESLWRSKRIGVSLEKDGAALVLGDESELRRAVMNLLANALHFTPEGGSIALSTQRTGMSGVLRISDTGFGVPETQRGRLFERLTPDVVRQGTGSGLGLYIVRRIAESHGGSVHYEPREPRGSTFILALPLAKPDIFHAGSAPHVEHTVGPHRSR